MKLQSFIFIIAAMVSVSALGQTHKVESFGPAKSLAFNLPRDPVGRQVTIMTIYNKADNSLYYMDLSADDTVEVPKVLGYNIPKDGRGNFVSVLVKYDKPSNKFFYWGGAGTGGSANLGDVKVLISDSLDANLIDTTGFFDRYGGVMSMANIVTPAMLVSSQKDSSAKYSYAWMRADSSETGRLLEIQFSRSSTSSSSGVTFPIIIPSSTVSDSIKWFIHEIRTQTGAGGTGYGGNWAHALIEIDLTVPNFNVSTPDTRMLCLYSDSANGVDINGWSYEVYGHYIGTAPYFGYGKYAGGFQGDMYTWTDAAMYGTQFGRQLTILGQSLGTFKRVKMSIGQAYANATSARFKVCVYVTLPPANTSTWYIGLKSFP